ncbi:MerC domain-containing protein [Edaphobacter sp. HDX4]|uniref:MerC domain-containing protein n=1 Tax=Edaphobacter sp. HDX4 TaxID=2794064 RepID=UPI002FE5E36E
MEGGKALRYLPDQLGIWASVVCVIHCIGTPVVLSVLPILAHYTPNEEKTHRLVALSITGVGGIALVRGLRIHGEWRVLWLMSAGLISVFTAAYLGDRLPSHNLEVLITIIGSTLMIAAHRLNHTFCHRCQCCVPARQEAG